MARSNNSFSLFFLHYYVSLVCLKERMGSFRKKKTQDIDPNKRCATQKSQLHRRSQEIMKIQELSLKQKA
jgi:hypothetical protein